MKSQKSPSKSDKSVEKKAPGKVTATAKKTSSPVEPSLKPAAAKPRRPTPKIPPILLEGDEAARPSVSGPGSRYALGPKAAALSSGGALDLGELPESYGTRRVLAAARDPHWLYVSWDLGKDELRAYNKKSVHGHLVVRTHVNKPGAAPHTEAHVHPESRNWFVHVGQGATRFVAELGFYLAGGQWESIAFSRSTFTPPDNFSEDASVEFATLPAAVSFQELIEMVKEAVAENVSLTQALTQHPSYAEAGGARGLSASVREWTPAQTAALEKLVSMDSMRRVWIGSLEITELIRRKMSGELSSMAAAGFAKPGKSGRPGAGPTSVSSPFGGASAGRGKGFWFNINAELIVYGATEPGATISIGGRKIQLRPDGSFSYRFSLPDGGYELPVQAVSAEGDDSRQAELKFSRRTHYVGAVGTHRQDERLKTPRANHVA